MMEQATSANADGSAGTSAPASCRKNDMGLEKFSFGVGSLFGIPIKVHVLLPAFVLVLSLFSLMDEPRGLNLARALLLFGVILFVTVLIHELGHSLAARALKMDAHAILLWPLGGLAFCGKASTPRDDLVVALAGPLTHIPQFIVWLLVYIPVYGASFGNYSISLTWSGSLEDHFWADIVRATLWMQVVLMAFNLLLPAYPLDGSRVLADLLTMSGMKPQAAGTVLLWVSGPLVLALIVLQFVNGVNILFLLVMVWILSSSMGLYQAVSAGQAHLHPLFNFPQQHADRFTPLQDGSSSFSEAPPAGHASPPTML